MLRPLSRERRLAVAAGSLASVSAALPALLSSMHQGLSDFTHGLLVGASLGVSVGIAAIAIRQQKKSRQSCG